MNNTDIDNLIKRLGQYFDGTGITIGIEAAEALDAQAKRIAELEEECGYNQRNAAMSQRESVQHLARIAELEAELAAARAVLERIATEPPVHNAAASLDRLMWAKEALPIAAARGEQPSPVKSCETCQQGSFVCGHWEAQTCNSPIWAKWQPKSDACPTCRGMGFHLPSEPKQDTTCPDCGTGKKEAK